MGLKPLRPILLPSLPVSNTMPRQILRAIAAAVLLFSHTLVARAAPPNLTVDKRDPTFGFPYGSTKIRGVNLG